VTVAGGAARRLSRGHAAILIASLSSLALLGGGGGWLLRDQVVKRSNEALRESTYLHTLLIAHRMFGADPPSGVLLPPSAFDRLARQIDQQLGVTISLPATDDEPLAFLGGRLLPLRDRPAALLIFERDQDHVSLLVAQVPSEGAQPTFHQRVQETSISVAKDGGFQLSVVGQVSPEEFELLQRIVDQESGRT
jgi:anti-sigma factor RsiW